jgi:hypothetical protein
VPTREHFITNAPQIYSHAPGSADYDQIGVPDVQLYPSRRPSFVTYEDLKFIVGPYQRGVVIAPAIAEPTGDAAYLLGITAPTVAPVLAATGSGTQTGNQIGYYSYVHKDNGVDIHESDLSPGSNTVSFTGAEERTWTLPGTGEEARVTHYRLYVSIDGEVPVFVADVAVGTTTVSENTTDYGDPPPVDEDGNLLNERGVPPYTRWCVKWHDRVWYGPDATNPYRFWYSMQGEGESVGPLNFIDLRDRESLTNLRGVGDDLACQGAHCTYQLVGYDESDFRMKKVSDKIGCISFFAATIIAETMWFPAQQAMYQYIPGGAIRNMLADDLNTKWSEDYKANPNVFENSIAINDKEESLYLLLLSYPTSPRSRFWVGHYLDIDPSNGGGGPMRWTFDYEGRAISTLGHLLDVGSMRESAYSASCDGYIRKRNDYENDDDDGDTYGKLLTLETPHFLPEAGKGPTGNGWLFQELHAYVKSEEKPWTIEVRVGEDDAWQARDPAWSRVVKASGSSIIGRRRVPQSGHHFPILRSGKGLIIKITQLRARGFSYDGVGFRYAPGLGARGLR